MEDQSSAGGPGRNRRVSLTGSRYRHPSDVARLVFFTLIVGALLLVDLLASDAVRAFNRELLVLIDGLPPVLVDGVVGLVQLLATVAPFALGVALLRRRSGSQLVVVLAAVGFAVGAMFLLDATLDVRVPLEEYGYRRVNSWFVGVEYPPAAMLAAITAVLVALSPQMDRRWRRTGWVFIIALVLARVLTATEVPIRNALLLAVGGLAGSLALVVVGAPRRRVDPALVVDGLAAIGITAADAPVERGTGATFDVATEEGDALLVTVLGRDQRDADLLIRGIRSALTKGLGDRRVVRSPQQATSEEALALALFRSAGARVPEAIAVSRLGDETSMLVTSAPAGRPLADLDDVSDTALADLWRNLRRAQDRRLAHRRLAPSNVWIVGDEVTLADLRWATASAADSVLAADVAELLVTTALTVGTDRAVSAASEQLTKTQLERAIPFVQAAACSPPTVEVLDELDDDDAFDLDAFLAAIRDAAAARVGVDNVEVAAVKRVTVRGVVSLVGSAVLVFYVLSLASDWEAIWDAFTRAELIYVLPVLLLAFSTYLTGAMSLHGSVPIDLAFGRSTAIMLGQSYLNRFTPANAGGMAMRVRYLQLEGLDAASAATSVGLTSAASGVAQGLMIVVFLVWGGASDRLSDFEFPAIGPIVVVLLAIGAVAWAVLASTWGREKVRPWLVTVIGQARTTISGVAADPTKLAQLFGGATLGKLANIAAFWLSAVAFDVDISFPKAGALYIIATTIGSAVPTPGGVGGVDAALTAALLGYGVPNADAAAIVLLFRMLTFWLPTLPGYVSLQYCQRKGFV